MILIRTAYIVSVMDSLCYATEHADRAVLSRQLELCRTLTGEFRMHYPIVCFKPSVWTKESGEETSVTLTSAYTLSVKLQVTKTSEAKTKEIVDAITDSVMHFSRSLFFQYGKGNMSPYLSVTPQWLDAR